MGSKKTKAKRRANTSDKRAPSQPPLPSEPRAVEVATVGWTVTVATVVMCDLGAVLAHGLALANPDAERVGVLRDLLMFAAATVGVFSLLLLPIVYRMRAVKPPLGFTVFAACAAAAPIAALIARAFNG
ncbi:MAG: hypothetical protein KDA44_17560 [Planctomycetales bacterium]|nr:hypothetical protein [Planctomycetales bacterium]